MALDWKGDELKRKVQRASIAAVNATMSAAIIHAKAGHGMGAHSQQRFVSRSGELERGTRIVMKAKPVGRGVLGRWGVQGVVYARRIELGFQGKDSAGRVIDAPAYPYLTPAKDAEHGKLAGRIRRAMARA